MARAGKMREAAPERAAFSGLPEGFVEPLLTWYDENARSLPWRAEPAPYRVWVSEVMLQQTRVEAVKPYFERFVAALPNPSALAACPEDALMKLWEGLGYYSRARNLQKAARLLVERHGGALPADYAALLALPGFGEYTAGAVASIAFGIPVPAVDGNVLRVASRLAASRADVSLPGTKAAVRAAFAGAMPRERPGDFNQALMELGAVVCVPGGAPKCGICPAAALCRARAEGVEGELPEKAAKKARRLERLTVFVILSDGAVLLRRRPETGLLAGLWELPWIEGHASAAEREAFFAGLGVPALSEEPLGAAKHVFTHIEWRMEGFLVRAGRFDSPEGYVLAPPGGRRRYAVPSAFQAYLPPED